MLNKVSLLCVLSVIGLALPALAAEEQAGATHCASYSISVNEYFNGVEVGNTWGGASESAEYSMSQICAPSEPGGIPNCFLLILPAQTRPEAAWPIIKEVLHGNILPPIREAMFHGLRIYYYFPYANDVKFTLSAREEGSGANQVVERVTIAQ